MIARHAVFAVAVFAFDFMPLRAGGMSCHISLLLLLMLRAAMLLRYVIATTHGMSHAADDAADFSRAIIIRCFRFSLLPPRC